MSAYVALFPAAICGFIGTIFLLIARDARSDIALMDETPTSPVSAVAGLAPGTLVELAGVLRCEAPVRSEMAGEPAAWYRATVTREFRETDGDRTTKREEVVHESVGHAACRVEDATGSVVVDLADARVEGELIVERLEHPSPAVGISIGGFRLGGGDTIRFRHEERVLRPDRPVYLLGVVRPDGSVGASPKVDRRLVVASQSEAERAIDKRADARIFALVGQASSAVAVLCLGAAGWLALG